MRTKVDYMHENIELLRDRIWQLEEDLPEDDDVLGDLRDALAVQESLLEETISEEVHNH